MLRKLMSPSWPSQEGGGDCRRLPECAPGSHAQPHRLGCDESVRPAAQSQSLCGNFTKITQRIEVRFELPETALALKPGMMVELKIAE